MVEFLGIILENTVGLYVGFLSGWIAGAFLMYFFKDMISEAMGWD